MSRILRILGLIALCALLVLGSITVPAWIAYRWLQGYVADPSPWPTPSTWQSPDVPPNFP